MSEVPLYFGGGGFDLFGVMHAAQAPARDVGFVFCAPFAEEKLWTHLVYVNFARELARRGHPVLRFDYRGTGDSAGDFEDATPQACVADTLCAIGALRERAGPLAGVGLLGLRFGATVAAMAAERCDDVRRLVLWSPVLRGGAYVQELLRVNLAMQIAQFKEVRRDREELVRAMREGQTTNVDGYEITLETYEQLGTIDLLAGPGAAAAARCLVVQIAPRPLEGPGPELLRLAAQYRDGRAVVSVEEPFWKEIKPLYTRAERLFAGTLGWMGGEHGAL